MIYHIQPKSELQEIGTICLARTTRAPSMARDAISRWLAYTHPARDNVLLAASELVTNAVKYAETPLPGTGRSDTITLHLSQGLSYLRLVVLDPGSTSSAPSATPPHRQDPYAEHGRGLAIVRDLSHNRWGSYQLPDSRRRLVWCHLALDPTLTYLGELFDIPA